MTQECKPVMVVRLFEQPVRVVDFVIQAELDEAERVATLNQTIHPIPLAGEITFSSPAAPGVVFTAYQVEEPSLVPDNLQQRIYVRRTPDLPTDPNLPLPPDIEFGTLALSIHDIGGWGKLDVIYLHGETREEYVGVVRRGWQDTDFDEPYPQPPREPTRQSMSTEKPAQPIPARR